MSSKWRAFAFVAALVLALDQVSKWAVRTRIGEYDIVPVIGSFFGLTHLRNPGSAFGTLQNLPVWFFIAISAVALLFVGSLLWRSDPQDRYAGTALGLIVGGALGNLVDRFYFREVIDFLRFDLRLFVFPPFNLADSGIVVGAGLLLLDITASEASDATLPEPNERAKPDGEAER